jgi:hypothetical protein
MRLKSTTYRRSIMDRFDVVGLISFCILMVVLVADYLELLQ